MLKSTLPSGFSGRWNPPPFAAIAMAIRPGRMTTNGTSILGKAATIGVRRAAFMSCATIARCTTRKSVHQYPNDSTKPRPMIMPNRPMPMGFASGEPM